MIADRLNPIVLKELRQGVKSRSFLAIFLGLQAVMVISMLLFLAALAANAGDLDFADGFFWFMLGLMVLLFMPLRAFQALNGEVKGHTLELLFLTRMTAWDIAFGKWLAYLTQVVLLVSAVLPYLVLRYFLGSVDLGDDLRRLFLHTLASGFLLACAVGLSSWSSRLLRGGVIFFALASLNFAPMILFGMNRTGGGVFAFWSWYDIGIGLIALVVGMLLMVEYGASQIAPPAENHAARKRGLGFGLGVLFGGMASFPDPAPERLFLAMALLIPVAVDALCEPLVGIRSLYVRLRWAGPFRWLLFPGWASGIPAVVTGFWLFTGWAMLLDPDPETFSALIAGFTFVLFPFLVIRCVRWIQSKPLAAYLLIQAISFIAMLLILFLDEIGFWTEFTVSGHLIPVVSLYLVFTGDGDLLSPGLILLPNLFLVGVLLLWARRPLLDMWRLSRESEA